MPIQEVGTLVEAPEVVRKEVGLTDSTVEALERGWREAVGRIFKD